MSSTGNLVEAGLSLGSNLGDRLANLRAAREKICAIPGVRPVAQSPIYETTPVGVKPKYEHLKFLNAVLVVELSVPVKVLHAFLAEIENTMGRDRGEDRFAPRTIDIDILYAGDEAREDAALTLPHPRWTLRRFVLQPLSDVRPELVLPGVQRPVRDILAALPAGESVALFATEW